MMMCFATATIIVIVIEKTNYNNYSNDNPYPVKAVIATKDITVIVTTTIIVHKKYPPCFSTLHTIREGGFMLKLLIISTPVSATSAPVS